MEKDPQPLESPPDPTVAPPGRLAWRDDDKLVQDYLIDRVGMEVKAEIERAESLHGPFCSFHEAIAIIREEFTELEREVFWGFEKTKSLDGLRKEAIQLSAMSLRLAMMVTFVPKEAYDRQVGPRTEMERRLQESLKEHIHPKYPGFCEVCYAQTPDSPNECTDCPFKDRWIKAKALVEECETQVTSPHVQADY